MEKPITEAGILEAYLIPWSRRLLRIPYLKALRETFCIMMPLIIMLALLNMAGSLVLNPLSCRTKGWAWAPSFPAGSMARLTGIPTSSS